MIWLKLPIKHYQKCFQKPKFFKLNSKMSPAVVNNSLNNLKVKLISSMSSKKNMMPLKKKKRI